MPKSIPEQSIDVQFLYARLMEAAEGETVSYAQLSAAIDRDVQGEARHLLAAAIRRALRDDAAVFAAVRNVGIKRLGDREIATAVSDVLPRVRRAVRRGVQRLAAVRDFDTLPPAEKTRHLMLQSTLGALAHMTKPKQIAEIERKVQEQQAALPLARTLEAFRRTPADPAAPAQEP